MTMNQQRIGKKSLRIDNKQSTIQAPQGNQSETKEEAIKAINEIAQSNNSYNEKAVSLANMFKKTLLDKTLADNKSVIAADAEKDLINNLSRLALEIENDQFSDPGMGPIGLSTLIFRLLLIQRDQINQLSYELEKLIGKDLPIKE
jgi:hypothetical protein